MWCILECPQTGVWKNPSSANFLHCQVLVEVVKRCFLLHWQWENAIARVCQTCTPTGFFASLLLRTGNRIIACHPVHFRDHACCPHLVDPYFSVPDVRLDEESGKFPSESPGHQRALRSAFHLQYVGGLRLLANTCFDRDTNVCKSISTAACGDRPDQMYPWLGPHRQALLTPNEIAM